MHKYLLKAVELIKRHNYDDHQEYHLCAIIVAGGNILSIGFNNSKRNGFVDAFKNPDRPWSNIHAEIDAILRARKKIDLSGSKIYIARTEKVMSDMIATARPCEMCQRALRSYGIKKAYYTIDNDTYAVMKI